MVRNLLPSPECDRVVIYTRVSTDKQADSGLSLSAQNEKTRAYAKLYNLRIVETVTDKGFSAKTLERPGLQEALRILKYGGADGLLVAKLDRLTRSVRSLGELLEGPFGNGGFALLSVGEQIDTRTAGGRLVLNVLASVAQWEREATVERTKLALHQKKMRDERTGSVPFGYQEIEGGKLIEDPAEQAVIQLVRARRKKGVTMKAIVEELNAGGPKPRGKKWHLTTIHRIIQRGA